MRSRKAWWAIAIFVGVLLVGIGIGAYYTAPTWTRNSIVNYETIRLTPMWLFESVEQCDVCSPRKTIGTWWRTGDGIALRALGSSKTRRMMKVKKGTCGLLMDVEDFKNLHGYNPLAAYALDGDPSCPDGAPVHPPE